LKFKWVGKTSSKKKTLGNILSGEIYMGWSELRDIESIVGDVHSKNKVKIGDVFKQIKSIEMAIEKIKG
jgi:hypothetical protein